MVYVSLHRRKAEESRFRLKRNYKKNFFSSLQKVFDKKEEREKKRKNKKKRNSQSLYEKSQFRYMINA